MTAADDIKAIARAAFWTAYIRGNGAAQADLFKAVDAAIDAVAAVRAAAAGDELVVLETSDITKT